MKEVQHRLFQYSRNVDMLKTLYKEEHSIAEIARRMNCNESSLRYQIKKHDFSR